MYHMSWRLQRTSSVRRIYRETGSSHVNGTWRWSPDGHAACGTAADYGMLQLSALQDESWQWWVHRTVVAWGNYTGPSRNQWWVRFVVNIKSASNFSWAPFWRLESRCLGTTFTFTFATTNYFGRRNLYRIHHSIHQSESGIIPTPKQILRNCGTSIKLINPLISITMHTSILIIWKKRIVQEHCTMYVTSLKHWVCKWMGYSQSF